MSRRDSRGAGRFSSSPQVRSQALQLWGIYLLALLAWVALSIILVTVLAALPWSATPFYTSILWLRDYIFFVYVAFILIGWAVISYFFLARPIRQLYALTQATSQLAQPTEKPIALPDGMEAVQEELNAVRERALWNARAAREAEQKKNDLIVYLAHDLKTPLTSVIGYLTLLRDEPQISSELRARYTGIALDKAQRLEELINEFFEITRFNLSHIELERQSRDIVMMLQQLISEFEPMLREKSLTCRLDAPEKLIYNCDPDKLARVFDNLLRNAVHYSFEGSEIAISCGSGGGGISIAFENRGRTIPPEKLERIFDQFFRLDDSRATNTGGAGLGLAIAREIVELHGGSITAQSWDNTIRFSIELP